MTGTKARGAWASNRRPLLTYRGPLFRVRRASDNAEQDIYPIPNTGWCNIWQLAAFCGAAHGYVKTAYDGTGNGYAITQTTTTKQPQVYDSSTGAIRNGRNCSMRFDSTDDVLAYTSNSLGFSTGDPNISIAVLMKFNAANPNSSNPGGSVLCELGTGTSRLYPYYSQTGSSSGSNRWHWAYSAVSVDAQYTPSPAHTSWHYNVLLHGTGELSSAIVWRTNGVLLTKVNTPTNEAFTIGSAGALHIGNQAAGSRPLYGDIALQAVFPAKLAGSALTVLEAQLEHMRTAA